MPKAALLDPQRAKFPVGARGRGGDRAGFPLLPPTQSPPLPGPGAVSATQPRLCLACAPVFHPLAYVCRTRPPPGRSEDPERKLGFGFGWGGGWPREFDPAMWPARAWQREPDVFRLRSARVNAMAQLASPPHRLVLRNLVPARRPARRLPSEVQPTSSNAHFGVPILKPMDLMVEASPRRIFANAHTYHINSISVNSDHETYLSADDLRINLWHLEITDRSFNIVDIKPINMEELTEVITAAEFHPHQCNVFVYSSSKGTIRLCDMRSSALCDRHSKFFEEPEDPSSRSFFSEIISSISDVKFSHGGRYMMTRDYLSVKVWDLNMESRPVETYQVHEYLRSKLCSLYENDCIFDKFECCWNGSDSALMTGSYNNFFRMFDRSTRRDVTLEASRESSKPRAILKPRKVCPGGKRKKDEISADSLDFNRKILHTAWHPLDNIIAVAATNNLYIFQDKIN
ncbi:serine/threonine-protein phosphatase 2A 55 kDa regulatory subunit B delta isoform isoform X2 [Gracilinanus agilis]|uniref:serine/threonine-protein phosphatase 2A 55 kDa regulatory subunit B delta isoform isoform X2 n=1 Tax=Gracilinanus agilis TaxID=191870 RepID=UPI001CFC4979|nr:serine/threonine-protein phosphatase 2A 55 kDa regulatory subunit B delta isoform isoform X2 [Gracilinanus agilis]